MKAAKEAQEREKTENSLEALDDSPNGLAVAQACGIWRLVGVALAPIRVYVPLDPEIPSVQLGGTLWQPTTAMG